MFNHRFGHRSGLTIVAVLSLLLIFTASTSATRPSQAPSGDGKLRIIAFGAHPDDCELQIGGVASLWAAKGHHVKLVSTTNGDIGHWQTAGGPLALRRIKEVQEVARKLGVANTTAFRVLQRMVAGGVLWQHPTSGRFYAPAARALLDRGARPDPARPAEMDTSNTRRNWLTYPFLLDRG